MGWPMLSAERDRPTIVALHLFSQMVGKVPTALLPWRNHGWHLTLHISPRGLRTETMFAGGRAFALLIDLQEHRLVLESPERDAAISIEAMSVAAFHAGLGNLLRDAGLPADFHGSPNEVEPAIPFAEDHEVRAYDPDSARRLHQALLQAARVFGLFRSGFLGKVSPVHLFWGSFDLAVTRFSGRSAPPHAGGIPNLPDAVTREAYSHEVSSAGFWPGGANAEGGPFFYSYAYPVPDGFARADIAPDAARYDESLGEFILDFEAVRSAAHPDGELLTFLETTYAAAAHAGEWDRGALECGRGVPAVPRAVR